METLQSFCYPFSAKAPSSWHSTTVPAFDFQNKKHATEENLVILFDFVPVNYCNHIDLSHHPLSEDQYVQGTRQDRSQDSHTKSPLQQSPIHVARGNTKDLCWGFDHGSSMISISRIPERLAQ